MIAPILKGKKVILRPIETKHAKERLAWYGDPQVIKYQIVDGNKSLKKEIELIKKHRRNKNTYVWYIYDNKGSLIGDTSIRNIDRIHKKATLSLNIGDKNYWNKGYGTDVTQALCKFFFKKIRYNRIELWVFPQNVAAIKIYHKCGFVKEGIGRQSVWKNGKFHNMLVMSLIKDDYKKFQP